MDILKRWFSIRVLSPTGKGPSPASLSSRQWGQPWPAVSPGHGLKPQQWIRYCFADEASSETLLPLLARAIARFAPSYQYSGMRIMPDLQCGTWKHVSDLWHWQPKWDCLCSDDMDGNALKISDNQASRDAARRSTASRTSVQGYEYRHENTRWRHTLEIGSYDHDRRAEKREHSIMVLTHELGHAIGLLHEHQRPDAGRYIDFHCKKLPGYGEAKDVVAKEKSSAFDKEATPDERMAKV